MSTVSKKQNFLQGALVLSIATVLVKVIGAVFKIPLQLIDTTAFGYFNAAYKIYIPIYTIAIAGLPIAVARMVSMSIARERYKDVRTIHKTAIKIFLLTGTVGTAVMLAASFWYPTFTGMPQVRATMLVMAPAILCCCLVSAYRGLYEGTRNMVPTAISQVLEAVGKLAFGLSLAYGMLYLGQWQYRETGTAFGQAVSSASEAVTVSLPFVAAGAMAGVTLGSLMALVYMLIRYRKSGDSITAEQLAMEQETMTSKEALKAVIAFAIPITLGSIAGQLSNIVDAVSLQYFLKNTLESHGDVVLQMYAEQMAADGVQIADTGVVLGWLVGSLGIPETYCSLVPNITMTFGVAALPIITAAWAANDRTQLENTAESTLRMTLLLSLPAGVGLSVLATPIMQLIYGANTASVTGPMLAVWGAAVSVICLINPLNSIFQAVGRPYVPVAVVLAGGLVKFILNAILISQPTLNIMGSVISTVSCYVVMVVLSLILLRVVAKIRLSYWRLVSKTLLAAAFCGILAYGAHKLLNLCISTNKSTILAIFVAIIGYVLALLLLKALKKEDILMLPKGEKIAQILEKRNWIG